MQSPVAFFLGRGAMGEQRTSVNRSGYGNRRT